jgi:hypothetical protein
VFSWALPAGISIFARQQAVRVTLIEQGDPWDQKRVERNWVYRPGVGVAWKPTGAGWLKFSAEASHATTAQVNITGLVATVAVGF